MKEYYYSRTDFLRRKRNKTYHQNDWWAVCLIRAYGFWQNFF